MSKSKIVGMMVLITFAMGIILVGDAMAGREATESLTIGIYCVSKVVTLGQDIYAGGDGFGTIVGETGNEMCHGAALHVAFGFQIEKGFYSCTGGVVWTLLNGDKIYLKFFESGKIGETAKGTLTVLGGTGKCVGIEGSAEYTKLPLVPSVEGIYQGLDKAKLHYKLP